MPRKKIKLEKQPLRFQEQPAGVARVHHSFPEVRAALNPKDFFTETQGHNGSALNAWVNPQFDTSAAALPVKRRRGKSSASIVGNFTQLSRKNSVCSSRFPTLLFETKSRDHQRQRQRVRNGRISLASNVQEVGATKTCVLQNDNIISHNGHSEKTTSLCQTREKSCTSSEGPSSHAPKDSTPADTVSPLPSGVMPKILEEYSSPNSKSLHLLWSPPCTPSSNSTVDILVPDTPEKDYGIKVTWRRRRKLMQLLKEKGHLTD